MAPLAPTAERPLVTFALFAYNQEQFIEEAIRGALSQTYSPLEIILSDDCSTDKTFEIMLRVTAEYRGPHRVIVQRQEVNRGIGGHINDILSVARGEWILEAAGDDVSMPQRAERIIQKWEEEHRRPRSIFSHGIVMDQDSKPMGRFETRLPPMMDPAFVCRHTMPGVIGCTHAFHRSAFDVFGPLLPYLVIEDRAIAFRSLLLGGWAVVAEPLVAYRRNTTSVSASWQLRGNLDDMRRSLSKRADMKHGMYLQWQRDLDFYCPDDEDAKREISRLDEIWRFNKAMQAVAFRARLRGFLRAWFSGVPWGYALKRFMGAAFTPFYRWRMETGRQGPFYGSERLDCEKFIIDQPQK